MEDDREHPRGVETLAEPHCAEIDHWIADVGQLPIDDGGHLVVLEQELVGTAVALNETCWSFEPWNVAIHP